MGKNKNKHKRFPKQDATDISGVGRGTQNPSHSTVRLTNIPTRTTATSSIHGGTESDVSLSEPISGHSSGTSSQQQHEQFADWNPMLEVSESLLNTVSFGGEKNDIGKLLTGVGDLDVKDVLCPFNDGKTPEGGCFKVSCPYKHVPYSSKVLKKLPKLELVSMSKSESTNTIALLPVQKLPADGCISKVAIPTAFHPGHFNVIPDKGWRCLCKVHDESAKEIGHYATVNSFDTLDSLQKAMENHFASGFANNHNTYLAGELVAVRMSSISSTRTICRAKVLTDSASCCDNEDDIFKPVNLELQLLDYGLRCIKSTLDVSNLPIQFCSISPLAYKCELFGVSPIIGSWSSLAIERFQHLVTHHYVIAEVVRTGSIAAYSLQDPSCLVSLFVKSKNGDFIDVAQDLIEAGLGIEWNMYPKRPNLNELLEGKRHRFALELS
ncbi:unnamed protein product [Orchesella dallaii]|uniref:Tudor domain-containing protein n=1 Tax=Orchesella dallaii TaxID=48710 RepID=A0ABP1QPV6_9HEXA